MNIDKEFKRIDERKYNELRKISFSLNYLNHPDGSVLIEFGKTRVICSVSIQNEVPGWMKAQKVPGGWLTAEYSLLPSSTGDRVKRERNGIGGRTHEIQRLIGRSLRAACDLSLLDGKTVFIDCDVIDADGGTRCASITGAMVALNLAVNKLLKQKTLSKNPIIKQIAAVSVGIISGTPILDLCYTEDSAAEVDMNVIMTEDMEIVEIQGTGEKNTFTRAQMSKMIDLAENGIQTILTIQKNVLNNTNFQ